MYGPVVGILAIIAMLILAKWLICTTMAISVLEDKMQRDYLYAKISRLEDELSVAIDNSNYYKSLLEKTRRQILEIKNAVGAESIVADIETVNQAWDRNITEIMLKVKDGF